MFTRALRRSGVMVLGAFVGIASGPGAATAWAQTSVNPCLYVAAHGLAVQDNTNLLFVNNQDDTFIPVIPANNIMRVGTLNPSSCGGWGWGLINQASKPSNVHAAGTPVYHAARNRIYYRRTDNNLGVYSLSGGTWTLTWWNIAGRMASDVSIEPDSGRLYYRGNDNNLWILGDAWNGFSSVDGKVTSAGDVWGQPVYDVGGWGTFYRDQTSKLRRAYWSNGWNFESCGNAVLSSDPVVNGPRSVVYRDANGRIGSTWFQWGIWNAGVWSQSASPTPVNVAGRPTFNPADGAVYYRGTDNRLWVCYWNGSPGFAAVPQTTLANVAGDIVTNSAGDVFYRSSNGQIWKR